MRQAALEALKALHFPHAFDPLTRIFREHDDPTVKEVALESIARIGSLEAGEFLVEVLRYEAEPLRQVARRQLARVRQPRHLSHPAQAPRARDERTGPASARADRARGGIAGGGVNELVTIPFSHFCEKARWALDYCQVPYVERACLPGLHLRHTKRIGGRTVPALIREDGSALVDSTDILRWADAQAPADRKLFPTDAAARAEADAFEEELDVGLGPATRLWAYANGLQNRPMLRDMVSPSFPRLRDRLLLALILPAVGKLIVQQYGATPDAGDRAEGVILEGFERVSRLLEKRPYLSGERFGGSDLTFTVLGGVMVMPRENRFLKHDTDMPPQMRAFVERLRKTRAGEHAARCWREYRG